MKPSTRIILNTLATYGRSVVGMALSLFSVRWILAALGQVDMGLYGVVGSIVLLITFLRGGLQVGVARFYAYSIGRGHHLSSEEATDDLQRWFNTAFLIHLILPFLLVAIGYPIGIYAIENWLTIPPDRVAACLWVFRISLVTVVVSTFSVPFIAMYTAHQHIAELALFGLVSTAGVFVGAYFLMGVQSDRLIVYALYMMVISAGMPLLQMLRAVLKFKACRIRISYLFNLDYLRGLFGFVGWKMFGMSCVAVRAQGTPILVNLFFGPQVNAAYTVSQRLSIQATTLSTAMMGAFQPAITTMEGRGNRQEMLDMALQVCKFGTLLVLFFVIPLSLEMNHVLILWLKNPPEYTGPLCVWMLAMLVVDRMTAGQMLAVGARGKIAMYELVQGITLFLAIPLMWLFFKWGMGPVSLGHAFFITMVVYCLGRLLFCKRLLEMPIGGWFRQVAVPMVLLVICSLGAGFFVMQLVQPGFLRICLTTMGTGLVTAGLGWVCLLNKAERAFVVSSLQKVARRVVASRKIHI